jgi:hypothetical protein
MSLQGPPGSGKSMSALLIAYGLSGDWKKIAVVDTERESANLYSHLGSYYVLTLEEPFTPERYIEAIKLCENSGIECIILDSISHEWSGPGGCLEIHEKATNAMKIPNSFTAWASVTPRHQAFIEANTESVTLLHLKNECIIPVFRDNEKTVSHYEFVDAVYHCVMKNFGRETILAPEIKVSHKINGRIPSALNKKVSELEDWENTQYWERMMFIIEVPSIRDTVSGNELSLTIGGVRALNHESLFTKKSIEKFKVFIGFTCKICTNLLVSTDGIALEIRVSSLQDLIKHVFELFGNYNMRMHLDTMREFGNYKLSEHQFAQLIGKARLFPYLPAEQKKTIPALNFGDGQFNAIARDYYTDKSFCRDPNGDINLWKLYGLFTSSNKSSYVDSFLDRSVNAFSFTESLV